MKGEVNWVVIPDTRQVFADGGSGIPNIIILLSFLL